ncbi:MAG: NF038143 family protein [Candidatus Mariimomonas ferrooxydans]
MEKSSVIWNNEVDQADKTARALIDTKRAEFRWKTPFYPPLLLAYIRFRKHLFLTRRNLLFTKQLAFESAKEISRGKDRAVERSSIEIKTKKILGKDGKGFYSEKIRLKQLHEIELLIDHYLQLLNSDGTSYEEMIKTAYKSKRECLSFLNKLQRTEQEVIQAAVVTMQKGSTQDRLKWFKKVQRVSRKARMDKMESIFSEG